jgi:site-specific DNA-methyltransferase (adenine-specific)
MAKRFTYHMGNVSDVYKKWRRPDVIISDGAYGVRGFPGDTVDESGLVEWYLPHVEAWSKYAKPSTSLWFWNTEVGWATAHPLLVANGWEYVQLVIWDKGLSHIAGNVNGKTIRQFPVVSEVSALYRRKLMLPSEEGTFPVKQWLRKEWQRSGIPLNKANEACDVKNAATRKYLTQDWLWYWPPGQAVEKMAQYCASHGKETARPYFSLDGTHEIDAATWDGLRARWNHKNGLTNVWTRPPLADGERLKVGHNNKTFHLNQKPLEFMERQIYATTEPGGIVWEPFGGLCSASVAAINLGRYPYTAEFNDNYASMALERLKEASKQAPKTEDDNA